MTRLFGPIVQNGFVVRDLDDAVRHWQDTVGVGPFQVTPQVRFAEVRYRGAPSAIEMAVAVAFSGALMIELIQPLSDAPSIYRDHLAAHGEGLQHVGVLADPYDDVLASARAAGIAEVQSGRLETGLRFAYLDTGGHHPGSMVELIEATPGMRRFLDRLRAGAWRREGGDG